MTFANEEKSSEPLVCMERIPAVSFDKLIVHAKYHHIMCNCMQHLFFYISLFMITVKTPLQGKSRTTSKLLTCYLNVQMSTSFHLNTVNPFPKAPETQLKMILNSARLPVQKRR